MGKKKNLNVEDIQQVHFDSIEAVQKKKKKITKTHGLFNMTREEASEFINDQFRPKIEEEETEE